MRRGNNGKNSFSVFSKAPSNNDNTREDARRLMRAALGLLVLLAFVPLASAQVPEDPVMLACDAVGDVDPAARDLLPVCARAEPQPPAQEDDAAAPPAPSAPPAPVAPQDAEDLAADITAEVERIPEDPAGAPDRLAAIVARVVGFVRELLDLPGAALDTLQTALLDAREGVQSGLERAGDAMAAAGVRIADAATTLREAVVSLLSPERAEDVRAADREPVGRAREAVDGLLELPVLGQL